MKRKTILILEDDPAQQGILMEICTFSHKNTMYIPFSATTENEALMQLALLGGKVDILVTDFNLETKTSERFIKLFRNVCGDKVLMISASVDGKDVARKLGVDYLDKPANLKDIVKSIKKLDK